MTAAQRAGIQGYRAPRHLRLALALLALAAVALLALCVQAALRRSTLRRLEAEAERAAGLPEGILARVRGYEKGHLMMVAPRPGGAACCGRYQIRVAALTSPDGEHLCRQARGLAAPFMAAQILDLSRRWCARNPGRCACPWARWNSGDAARLCRAIGGDEV